MGSETRKSKIQANQESQSKDDWSRRSLLWVCGFDSPGDILKQNVPHNCPTREGRGSIYSQAPVLYWWRVSQLLINSSAFSSCHFQVDTFIKITVHVPPDPIGWIPWKPWGRTRGTWRKQLKPWTVRSHLHEHGTHSNGWSRKVYQQAPKVPNTRP